jgi:hypothetical protein
MPVPFSKMNTATYASTETDELIAKPTESRNQSRAMKILGGVAAGAFVIGGAFAMVSNSSSASKMSQLSTISKLGGAPTRKFTLSVACSPLDSKTLTFASNETDWDDVSARFATKGQDNDFMFNKAKPMTKTSCGEWEVDADIDAGEEFGFFLHPKDVEEDFYTVLDIGCKEEKGAKCPEFAVRSPMVEGSCTKEFVHNGAKFWNRIWDGETTHFNWGTCQTECGKEKADQCVEPEPEPYDMVTCHVTIDNTLSNFSYNGKSLTPMEGKNGYNDWGTESVYQFKDEGASAILDITGFEWDTCNGCGCSGLGMRCVSDNSDSKWHNFVSDTTHWQAKIETPEELVGNTYTHSSWTRQVSAAGDNSYGKPCVSSSAFSLKGQTVNSDCNANGSDGKYCKIWRATDAGVDANMNQYVHFQGSPYKTYGPEPL